MRFISIIFCVVAIFSDEFAYGSECDGTASGLVTVEVEKCSVIDSAKVFRSKSNLPSWLTEMTGTEMARFLKPYNGLLITGRIKKSAAIVKSGLSKTRQAFKGELLKVFLSNVSGGCSFVSKRQIVGKFQEQCCSGGGEVPCLLGTPYKLTDVKPYKARDAQKTARKAKSSNVTKKGKALFRQQRYSRALPYLKKAYSRSELDLQGVWMLAFAWHRAGQCEQAIAPLTQVAAAWKKGNTTGADDAFAGPAILLLARCHARSSRAKKAGSALDLLLASPKRFRIQINAAARHSDFDWIRTSRQYQSFMRSARAILRKKK